MPKANLTIYFLLGYDYTDALLNIDCEGAYVIIDKSTLDFFEESNIELLRNEFGQRLIFLDKNQTVESHIKEGKDCFSLVTLGWRRILDLNSFSNSKYLINVHPALLPEYKGYHPVPFVILNEEVEHGITAHYLTEEVDSGDIVLQYKFKISTFSTLRSLQFIVKNAMPDFLNDLVFKIRNDELQSIQKNTEGKVKVLAKKRTPKDSEVNLDMPLREVFKIYKASDPERFPAYFTLNDEKVLISFSRENTNFRQTPFDV